MISLSLASLIQRLAAACAAGALASLALLAGGPAPSTLAHGPNPLFGTNLWGQDQIVGYMWAPGAVPPGWMAAEIDAAAEDVEQSRKSRAALFQRVSKADSKIWYGGMWPCPAYGIACVNRSGAPDSFAGMWFRPHGWPFDWGTLRWCQGLAAPANGCYDVENVALDEFGHIEIIGHHVNYDDERDFLDSIVQYAARARPREGWNEHVFGRCDVARLQLEYELIRPSDPVSTCLSLATSLSIVPGSTWISPGQTVRISGNLKVGTASAARSLSGDPLSARTVTLQRRSPGTTGWSAVGTLPANATAGSYSLTITPPQTYDYRLVFTPAAEGVLASQTGAVRIVVSACPGTVAREARTPQVPCQY